MHNNRRWNATILLTLLSSSTFLFAIASIITPVSASIVPHRAEIYIFAGNESGLRQPFRSNGDGTFTPTDSITYGDNNRGGALADYDEDGDLDFVGCNDDISECHLFRQTAPGVFSQSTSIAGGAFPLAGVEAGMAADDFNQDGHADVLMGGGQAVASIFFGDGTGSFPTTTTNLQPTASAGAYTAKDSGDLDGNGYPDVIIGVIGGGNIYTYLNTAGTFTGPFLLFDATPSVAAPNIVAVADFDGDGFIDIIAGGEASGEVNLWKGDGTGNSTGSFSFHSTIHDFNTQTSGDSYDFDSDGDQDLVALTRSTGQIFYIEGNGNGTFLSPVLVGSIPPSAFGLAAPPAPPIGSKVAGHVFHDLDTDGNDDDGLGGVGGVLLTLAGTDFRGNAVNLSAPSDANGLYAIHNIPIDNGGGYTLTATPPNPPPTLYSPTTAISHSLSIPEENTSRSEAFGFLLCTDADGDGSATEGGACGPVDCNDTSPNIHPGATEQCNGIDDDCNGIVDEGFDQDGDGYAACAGDCNDTTSVAGGASITITVADIVSTGPGADMTADLYVGNDPSPFGSTTVTIPLALHGVPIIDPAASPDVPGLHILRGAKNGKPFVRISAYGHNKKSTREHAEGTIAFSEATIRSVQNGPNGPYEKPSNDKCTTPGDDEYELSANESTGTFCSTTNVHSDTLTIFYKLDQANAQCADLIDPATQCARPLYSACGACIHPGMTDIFGDGIDSNCDGNAECGMQTEYVERKCSGKVRVKNDAELDAYLLDFGLKNGKYRTVEIAYDLQRPLIDIHSPCKIIIEKNTAISGDTICLDGRKGVRAEPRTSITGSKIALLSEKGSVWLKTNGIISAATDLILQGWKKVLIGSKAAVAGTSDARFLSFGKKGTVSVNPHSMVNTALLHIAAAKKARIASHAAVSISGDFFMEAPLCSIHRNATIAAATVAGSCLVNNSSPLNDEEGEEEDPELMGDTEN